MTDQVFLILALAAGFYMAWNIGANDVANAFGTSVGSGAITFRQAMIFAAIFEFAGAFLVGSHVADTIKGNIVQPSVFAHDPMLFATGMLAALLAASIWLNVATYLAQPVSTTHSIIGAVIGFGLMAAGVDSVQWHKMGRIAASWFVSPVLGALLAFALYLLIRKTVLRHAEPARRAARALPLGFGATCFVMVFSGVVDLLPRVVPSLKGSALYATAVGAGLLVAALGGFGAWLYWRKAALMTGTPLAEQYEVVERRFGRLQILTACYMAFAHGANDVANAIGPVAGILQALKGGIAAKTAVPSWILVFGGLGIVIGLATYGRKVMAAVGSKITEVTPTRGFAAEFATASTVLVSSLLGLPISTTFVLVGAVMGVGFARGFGAIDLGVVKRIFLSWVVTIPCSALLSALLYLGLRALVQ
jgi:PiT family inorganic phosphate transporter